MLPSGLFLTRILIDRSPLISEGKMILLGILRIQNVNLKDPLFLPCGTVEARIGGLGYDDELSV